MMTRCDTKKVAARNPLLYAKRATVSIQRLGRKRPPGVYLRVGFLPLQRVSSPAEFQRVNGELNENEVLILVPDPGRRSPIRSSRPGNVAVQTPFPGQQVKARYGFLPNQTWLDHVRMSSVRFNNAAPDRSYLPMA